MLGFRSCVPRIYSLDGSNTIVEAQKQQYL